MILIEEQKEKHRTNVKLLNHGHGMNVVLFRSEIVRSFEITQTYVLLDEIK